MKSLLEIERAINFIELHLHEPLTIRDAAAAAGYSLYHFCRLFNGLTGHSPYDYIMRRRLSEAAKALVENRRTVTEVALDFQFNSPETFSRAYFKLFGQLPHVTKQNRHLGGMILKARITLEYLEHIGVRQPLVAEMIQLPAFCLTGIVTRDPATCSEQRLLHNALLGKNRQNPEDCYAVYFEPVDQDSIGGAVLIGSVTKRRVATPDIMVEKAFPAQAYARFIHKGCRTKLNLTFAFILQTWLPKSGCRWGAPYILAGYASRESLLEDNGDAGEFTVLVPLKACVN
ncbi:MAG TPA: AraC family transcriptional regulator [Bacillota bacterium]|nr:AraC family transcriptional regulator [Bacillota bacterium]